MVVRVALTVEDLGVEFDHVSFAGVEGIVVAADFDGTHQKWTRKVVE